MSLTPGAVCFMLDRMELLNLYMHDMHAMLQAVVAQKLEGRPLAQIS